ncbi:hypothetical protein MTO96_037557 [Rhipicephalus appendiculatus]
MTRRPSTLNVIIRPCEIDQGCSPLEETPFIMIDPIVINNGNVLLSATCAQKLVATTATPGATPKHPNIAAPKDEM